MDQREARKYVTANPPADYNAERRPSLLGRLLRRMSSSEESPNATMQPQQNFDATTGGIRRGSITEAVQQQYVITKPPKQVLRPDSESHLFT